MSRKPRVWYPGAIYHIMCRGNHRHDIFRDEEDRQVYLERLLVAKTEHRCNVFSYCLMTNHVHLQLETTDVHISHMMQRVNMMYVIYFNAKYNFVGHLFQGRYRAELITTDSYAIEISKYIHLNPVSANIVEFPIEYAWSSYGNYLGLKQDQLVSAESILGYFSGNRSKMYQHFVERNLGF